MPYKDLEKRREAVRNSCRKRRGYRGPLTHCKNGHEFTLENTYNPPGQAKRCCRACRANTAKRLNIVNKDRIAETRRARRKHHRMPSDSPESKRRTVLKRIGWTFELFEKELVKQNNKCAICGKEMNLNNKQNHARACADHEHSVPPKPRGVLCSGCNRGIGFLQENIEILKSAVLYLEKYGKGKA